MIWLTDWWNFVLCWGKLSIVNDGMIHACFRTSYHKGGGDLTLNVVWWRARWWRTTGPGCWSLGWRRSTTPFWTGCRSWSRRRSSLPASSATRWPPGFWRACLFHRRTLRRPATSSSCWLSAPSDCSPKAHWSGSHTSPPPHTSCIRRTGSVVSGSSCVLQLCPQVPAVSTKNSVGFWSSPIHLQKFP